jgi:RNA-directed DNA polymerase
MLKDKSEAEKCLGQVSKFLKDELGLDLHPLGKKTKIIDLTKEPFTFLSITYDGKAFYPNEKSVQLFSEKIDSLCFGAKSEKSILRIMTSIRNTLDGWLSSYSFTDVDRYTEFIDAHINKQFYLYLRGKEWKFSAAVRGRLKRKFVIKGSSGDCLSDTQRANSGISFAKTILRERRTDNTEN